MKIMNIDGSALHAIRRRVVLVLLSLFLVVGLAPIAAPSKASATEGDAASFVSYSIHTYRESAYGTPPDGVASTDGCHFVIEATFPDDLNLTDATAAAASFNMSGTVGGMSCKEVTVSGKVFTLNVTTDYMPGGELEIASATIAGVTCGGKTVTWPAMDTIVPTGLAFHTTSVVQGTTTTCASTTIEIDRSAAIRSMNHILWTSNGNSIISGSGAAQTTAAHHHTYWNFTLKDSANTIQSNAASTLATLGYSVAISDDGYGVTLTANTPKAGEYLGIYNYDDDFLQANGLTLGSSVTGLAAPTASALCDISVRAAVTLPDAVEYTGQALTPAVTVVDGRYGTLSQGIDYNVSYTDNTDLGTGATATVTGIGAYSGTVSKTFRIARQLAGSMFAVDTSPVVFKGSAYSRTITSSLVEGVDYSASYTDNAFPGTATITITGIGTYMGTLTYQFVIEPAPLTVTQFSVPTNTRTYTGTAIEPVVTSSLHKGSNYTVSYSENRNVGTATIKVTGIGSYTGTLIYHFKISLATSSITKIRSGKGELSLSWTKSGASVYKACYRIKGASGWKATKTSRTYLTLKSLKRGRYYQVKIISLKGSAETTSKVKTSSKIR